MQKLLLILLCFPFISFGQNKYNIDLSKKVITEDLELSFSNIKFSKKAIFDRYGSKYQYRGPAERGDIFLVADLNIKSKIKNPLLPCIFMYYIDNNDNLELISYGPVQYSFYKWDNYRTFNGLEHDYNNDFRYTEEIKFSLTSHLQGNHIDLNGISQELNKVTLLLMMHQNDNKVYKDVGAPRPQCYSTSDCRIKWRLTLEEAKKEFYFIETFNGFQNRTDEIEIEVEEDDVVDFFMVVENMPEFPGGELGLMKYIQKNLKYPVIAKEYNITGKVYISFIVDKTGSVTNVKVVRGVDKNLDDEAIRVIKSLPKYKPGTQRGKPARVMLIVPIDFKLN